MLSHLLRKSQPRALQVSPRAEQHKQGDLHREAQEAFEVAAPGHCCHRHSVSAAEVAGCLPGCPTLLELVPDSP